MNLPNWLHDPYVEATYPPDKLERVVTELDRLLTTSARKPPLRSARLEAEIALWPF
jgi:hypothetical protein